jgi:hypothetical protein
LTTHNTKQQTQPGEHCLAGKECSPFSSWTEWETCFAQNTKLPVLLGILHCAPKVPCNTQEKLAQKYCTLLELADGYRALPRETFLSREEQKYISDWNDIHEQTRKELAQKAFWALGQTLFRDQNKQRIFFNFKDEPFAQEAISIPEIYQKLLWFMDDTERRTLGNNIPPRNHILAGKDTNHTIQLLVEFIKNFLEFAWEQITTNFFMEKEPLPNQTFLPSSRPQLLKIFYLSGNLDWFTERDHHKKLCSIDMKQIKEMVLWANGRFLRDQSALMAQHATLEQALYAHANGAREYLILAARRKEEAHILAELRSEQKKQAKNQRERERQALEKKKEEIEQKLKEF